MSRRTEKVESLVREVVALQLPELMSAHAGNVTVTKVDVTPDLKNATVWVSIVAADAETVFAEVLAVRMEVQHQVAIKMTTKFTPKLTFRMDEGGEYADYINRLLKESKQSD